MLTFLKKLIIIGLFFSPFTLFAEIVIAFDTKSFGDPNKPSKHQEFELNKIAKIAKNNKIKVKFKAIPWRRSLLMLEKGLIDGLIQASYKKQRAKYANYPFTNGRLDSSKRLNDGNSYYIYKNINSPLRWDGEKFLNTGIVGVMDKYAVIDDLLKHQNIKIKTLTNNSEIVREVALGKIDAYAGSRKLTDKLLKKIPKLSKQIVRESLPIRKKDYHLIFSKITYSKKSKSMEKIWDGLKEFNLNNN